MLGAINRFVNGLGEEHEAYVAWHYREVITSDSPLIAALKANAGVTDDHLHAAFELARTL